MFQRNYIYEENTILDFDKKGMLQFLNKFIKYHNK